MPPNLDFSQFNPILFLPLIFEYLQEFYIIWFLPPNLDYSQFNPNLFLSPNLDYFQEFAIIWFLPPDLDYLQEFNPIWFLPPDSYLASWHQYNAKYYPSSGEKVVFIHANCISSWKVKYDIRQMIDKNVCIRELHWLRFVSIVRNHFILVEFIVVLLVAHKVIG